VWRLWLRLARRLWRAARARTSPRYVRSISELQTLGPLLRIDQGVPAMGSDVVIGVAGATGALGKEVVAVLDTAPWRPDRVVPLASAATAVSFVQYGGEDLAVDDLSEQAFEALDGLVIAVPGAVADPIVDRAIEHGILVVDCSGAAVAREDVPLVVPWVNPEVLVEAPLGALATPHPAATLLASVLGPLRRSGLGGPAHAKVLLPGSMAGRAGVE